MREKLKNESLFFLKNLDIVNPSIIQFIKINQTYA